MSRHDPMVRMRHMLDHAREAMQYAEGRSRQDLDTDRQFYLVMVHLTEIVGEAAWRVGERERAKRSTIPWNKIIGFRHRLVHGYDTVDLDFLWQTVTQDFPHLVAELERILPPLLP